MSRSAFSCRHCKEPLGEIKPSGILHPRPEVRVVFIDHQKGTTTLRCPKCGATIEARCQRVELDEQRRTA